MPVKVFRCAVPPLSEPHIRTNTPLRSSALCPHSRHWACEMVVPRPFQLVRVSVVMEDHPGAIGIRPETFNALSTATVPGRNEGDELIVTSDGC